jgi:hypothetical protein
VLNGDLVSDELIEQERARLSSGPSLAGIADAAQREAQLQRSAELSAINRMLIAQAAGADSRPIGRAAVESELRRVKSTGACRTGHDGGLLRQQIEANFRLGRGCFRGRRSGGSFRSERIRLVHDDGKHMGVVRGLLRYGVAGVRVPVESDGSGSGRESGAHGRLLSLGMRLGSFDVRAEQRYR